MTTKESIAQAETRINTAIMYIDKASGADPECPGRKHLEDARDNLYEGREFLGDIKVAEPDE